MVRRDRHTTHTWYADTVGASAHSAAAATMITVLIFIRGCFTGTQTAFSGSDARWDGVVNSYRKKCGLLSRV
jgi:hypothetical protein